MPHVPQRPNIYYLGQKAYEDLPSYIAGWDAAILPFAKNRSTQFISPTKTPEYLAAGRPVVSTSIRDVVRPYGDMGLVFIADTVEDFTACIKKAILPGRAKTLRQQAADAYLKGMSWDQTWEQMNSLVSRAIAKNANRRLGAIEPWPASDRRSKTKDRRQHAT